MVKDSKLLKKFEADLVRKDKTGYHQNIKIVNALLRYALSMRKFPPKNRLEGIELDIRFAKAMNSVR